MRIAECDIIFIAGVHRLHGDHWMKRWGERFPNTHHVLFKTDRAGYGDALAKLHIVLRKTKRPVVFVTHGVGANVLALASELLTNFPAHGAFIVNPWKLCCLPEVLPEGKRESGGELPQSDVSEDYSQNPFSFPVVFVASRTGDGVSFSEIQQLGEAWKVPVFDAGEAGKLDETSGHGPWPEGLMSFAGFLKRL